MIDDVWKRSDVNPVFSAGARELLTVHGGHERFSVRPGSPGLEAAEVDRRRRASRRKLANAPRAEVVLFSPPVKKILGNIIRDALVNAIGSQPRATIADLLEVVRSEDGLILRGITLGELAGTNGQTANRGADQPAKRTAGTRKQPAARSATPETRTADGRAAYDQAMLDTLAAVGGGPVAASELIAKVGGTALQARTSLNRLIAAGKATFTGKARGTRYKLTR